MNNKQFFIYIDFLNITKCLIRTTGVTLRWVTMGNSGTIKDADNKF